MAEAVLEISEDAVVDAFLDLDAQGISAKSFHRWRRAPICNERTERVDQQSRAQERDPSDSSMTDNQA